MTDSVVNTLGVPPSTDEGKLVETKVVTQVLITQSGSTVMSVAEVGIFRLHRKPRGKSKWVQVIKLTTMEQKK